MYKTCSSLHIWKRQKVKKNTPPSRLHVFQERSRTFSAAWFCSRKVQALPSVQTCHRLKETKYSAKTESCWTARTLCQIKMGQRTSLPAPATVLLSSYLFTVSKEDRMLQSGNHVLTLPSCFILPKKTFAISFCEKQYGFINIHFRFSWCSRA